MSGGHFEYREHNLQMIIEELEHIINNNNNTDLDEWGYPRGRLYSEKTIEEFKKTLTLCKISYARLHRIDYLLSGDDGEETFHKRLYDVLNRIEG